MRLHDIEPANIYKSIRSLRDQGASDADIMRMRREGIIELQNGSLADMTSEEIEANRLTEEIMPGLEVDYYTWTAQ